MPRYRRNRFREDVISRHGQTTGLPLFKGISKPLPEPVKSRFENAPRAIALATNTKKLARVVTAYDPVELGDKQQKVFDVIQERGPITNSELARELDWRINTVVPRVYELRQYGLVVPAGKRQCRVTAMIVQTWVWAGGIIGAGTIVGQDSSPGVRENLPRSS